MKGLMQQQSRKVLEMYSEGESVQDIASELRVPEETIHAFIPKGELALAYQNVIKARAAHRKVSSVCQETVKEKASLQDSQIACASAITSLEDAIKMTANCLKGLRATKKKTASQADSIKQRLSEIDSELVDDNERLDKAKAEFDATQGALEDAKQLDADNRRKVAEAEAKRIKAEQLAETAIISAAVTAAKELVADSVEKRLGD